MASWSHTDADGVVHTIEVKLGVRAESARPGSDVTRVSVYGLSSIAAGTAAADLAQRFGAEIYAAVLAEVRSVLAAWRPPTPTTTRDACAVCWTLPAECVANRFHDQELPATGFVDVHATMSGAIRRCPWCATYYHYSEVFSIGSECEHSHYLWRLTDRDAAAQLEPLLAPEAAWLRSR